MRIVVLIVANFFLGTTTVSAVELPAKLNYGVNFPLFQKAPVKGENKQPVFKFLTESEPKELQGEVKWNFEKFLVDRNGKLVARFPAKMKPDDPKLVKALEAALKEPQPAALAKKKAT